MLPPILVEKNSNFQIKLEGVPKFTTKKFNNTKFTAMIVEIIYREWDTDEVKTTKSMVFDMDDARSEADLICGDVISIKVLSHEY